MPEDAVAAFAPPLAFGAFLRLSRPDERPPLPLACDELLASIGNRSAGLRKITSHG